MFERIRGVFGVGLVFATMLTGCGVSEEPSSVVVSWVFDEGDCASNEVETVRVDWSHNGGAVTQTDFACADGRGTLPGIEASGTVEISAVGLSADGKSKVSYLGSTSSFGGGIPGEVTIDIDLRPAPVDLLVTWSTPSGNCPANVVLPHFITVFDGGEQIATAQETCSSGQVTMMRIPPGDYVVEVDTRAQVPALKGVSPVTIVSGEEAMVEVQMQ